MAETTLTQEATPDNQPVATGAEPVAQEPAVSDWRAGLPADLRGEKMFENIKAKDAAEALPTLAKGYRDAQKLVGSSMGKLPGKDAKPEEIKAWREANLGKLTAAGLIDAPPESPDKYTAKLMRDGAPMEVDPAAMESVFKQFHQIGLTDKQAQAMLDLYDQQSVSLGGSAKETMAELQKEWGGAAPKQIKAAIQAVKQMGGDELIDVLEKTGLGNHPALIKTFAKVGAMLQEDDPVFADVVRDSDGQAKADKDKIMNDPKHPYYNPEHPGHKKAVAEVKRLNEIIYAQI